jgi:hypothetical protein
MLKTKHEMLFKEMLMDYKKKHIDINSNIWINYCITHNNFTLEKAINVFCGKKDIVLYNRHIYRIPQTKLDNFKDMLISIKHKIKKMENFDVLLNCISVKKIYGIGPVTLYDITLLLSSCKGFDLNNEPHYVYSHSGTKIGLKNLCGKTGKDKYEKNELGKPFSNSRLSPARLEDFLCRYKDGQINK